MQFWFLMQAHSCLEKKRGKVIIKGRIPLTLFAIVLLLGLLSACTTVELPSTSDISEMQAGKTSLVLLRVVGKEPDGSPLKPFQDGLVDSSVGFALGSPLTGSVPKGRIEDIHFLSDKSRDEGWIYLILPPGTHYIAVQPPRHNNLFTYLDTFKYAPRWVFEVPAGVPIIYIGTLDLMGLSAKGVVFGNSIFYAFDKQRSFVRDEEGLARSLASMHLPSLHPFQAVLMEPHHP